MLVFIALENKNQLEGEYFTCGSWFSQRGGVSVRVSVGACQLVVYIEFRGRVVELCT